MCDTIVALPGTTAGAVLFAKNSDRAFDEPQYLEQVPAARHEDGSRVRLTYVDIEQARETHAVLLSKPWWIWGAEIGANEHGLVIGNEALFSKIDASLEPGIIGMDYLRLALERASTVDEAIHVITQLLRVHGQSGNCGVGNPIAYHNSFLIADAHCAKVLETVDREWVVASVVDRYAISNAMTIESGYQTASPNLLHRARQLGPGVSGETFNWRLVFEDPQKSISGRHRQARAAGMLHASNELRAPDFFAILRDHQEGPVIEGRPRPRICMHSRHNPIGQTTASWVSSVGRGGAIHWVTGTAAPCTGLFKPVVFNFAMPAHGRKPTPAVEDRESLWWKHELLHRYLDGVIPEIREVFLRERDSLETEFVRVHEEIASSTGGENLQALRTFVDNSWSKALAFEKRWLDQLSRSSEALQAAAE